MPVNPSPAIHDSPSQKEQGEKVIPDIAESDDDKESQPASSKPVSLMPDLSNFKPPAPVPPPGISHPSPLPKAQSPKPGHLTPPPVPDLPIQAIGDNDMPKVKPSSEISNVPFVKPEPPLKWDSDSTDNEDSPESGGDELEKFLDESGKPDKNRKSRKGKKPLYGAKPATSSRKVTVAVAVVVGIFVLALIAAVALFYINSVSSYDLPEDDLSAVPANNDIPGSNETNPSDSPEIPSRKPMARPDEDPFADIFNEVKKAPPPAADSNAPVEVKPTQEEVYRIWRDTNKLDDSYPALISSLGSNTPLTPFWRAVGTILRIHERDHISLQPSKEFLSIIKQALTTVHQARNGGEIPHVVAELPENSPEVMLALWMSKQLYIAGASEVRIMGLHAEGRKPLAYVEFDMDVSGQSYTRTIDMTVETAVFMAPGQSPAIPDGYMVIPIAP